MKHNIKYVFALAFMLLMTQGAWADSTVSIIKLLNGTTVTTTSPGEVTYEIADDVCTLTVTPSSGYYVTSEYVTAYSVVTGDVAQAPRRTNPNLDNDPITVTAVGDHSDPSGVTQYSLPMPADGSNVEVTVNFQGRIEISKAIITLAMTSYTYDGTEKKPSVSSVVLGETTLAEGDYEVSYSNNINVSKTASATVTVTGLRTYTGTASTTFTISPKSITTDMITLSPSSFVYNGKKQVPTVTVTDGDVTLVGDDYDISFELVVENEDPSVIEDENTIIDVATYNVVVNGKGNYTGSARKSFDITKAALTLSVTLDGWTYGEEYNEPEVVGIKEESVVDFYFKVKDADDNTYTTIIPENAGNYTVKVVVAETDNYASGSATADFTIAKAPLNDPEFERKLTVSITGWKYGATPNAPSVEGNLGNGEVTYTYKDAEDDQAEFTETVPTNVGSYLIKATVAESDNYLGDEAENEFSIEKGDIPALTVSTIDGQTYDGEAHALISVSGAPEGTTVKYYYSEIEADDYENGSFQLMCEPDASSFSATVPTMTNVGYFALLYRVEGGDSYTDKEAGKLIKVAIYPAEITDVTIDETVFTYDILAHTPTITGVKAGDLVLKNDDNTNDYTVSYEKIEDEATTEINASEIKAVGSYNVVVTGQGNFKGTKRATFSIVNRMLADDEVEFHNNWATFYNAVGDVDLPSGIGAYIATQVNNNEVIVTQIKNVPAGVAVLLNNNTTTTTENTSTTGNLLRHADKNIDVYNSTNYYGLYNGKFMRVKGTIYADRNYLLVPEVVQPANAPQLTIVFEGGTTGIGASLVNSEKRKVNSEVYDLQGRKVEKPSKKGLYINKGQKVVVK